MSSSSSSAAPAANRIIPPQVNPLPNNFVQAPPRNAPCSKEKVAFCVLSLLAIIIGSMILGDVETLRNIGSIGGGLILGVGLVIPIIIAVKSYYSRPSERGIDVLKNNIHQQIWSNLQAILPNYPAAQLHYARIFIFTKRGDNPAVALPEFTIVDVAQLSQGLSQGLMAHADISLERDQVEYVCVVKGQFANSNPHYKVIHFHNVDGDIYSTASPDSAVVVQALLNKQFVQPAVGSPYSPGIVDLKIIPNQQFPENFA